MKLLYKALSKDRRVIHGTIDAKDTQEAANYLRAHQMLPITIIEASSSFLNIFSKTLKRSSQSDIVFFTRQLASMLTAGLTLIQALGVLKNQVQNKAMADVIQGLISHIEEGGTFSESLGKYPNLFSPIYIALVKAAESSGLLDKILLRLADNLEKQQELVSSIKSVLLYPVMVIVLMIGVFIIMTVFVIPQLTTLYQSLNFPLPFAMQVAISLSNIMKVLWPFLLLFLLLSPYLYMRWYKTTRGKFIMDSIFLKLPVIKTLTQQSIMADFARTFGLLVGAGTPIVDALQKSADVVGNIHYKNAILAVGKRVEKGIALGDAMSAGTLFAPMLVETVRVGEQTGKVDESLLRVSAYFEREVDTVVKNLSTLLQPFIITILAVGVAFLIYIIITPIYHLISEIQ